MNQNWSRCRLIKKLFPFDWKEICGYFSQDFYTYTYVYIFFTPNTNFICHVLKNWYGSPICLLFCITRPAGSIWKKNFLWNRRFVQVISKGIFPIENFSSDNFPNVKFPKQQLPKWQCFPSINFPKVRIAFWGP